VEHVKLDQVAERVSPRDTPGREAPGNDARPRHAPAKRAPGKDIQDGSRKDAVRTDVPQRLRRRFLRTNALLFIATFVLPLVAFWAYLMFFASDRYESEASTTITEEKVAASTIDLTVLGVTNAAADKDSLILKEFVESKDMLVFLDERLRIREHVTQPSIDFYSRLDPEATLEEFHDYYQWLVTVEYDLTSKLIRFGVQGFDERFAHDLLTLIVERSQQFIDTINEQITREQLRFFDREIADSEDRLKLAKEALIAFQRENRLMTTEAESATVMATIQTLEQGLAQKESDLNARLQVLDRSAPQLQTLQMDIKALESQILSAKERLAGASSTSISELDSQFREIALNLEFVTNIYKSNLTALEQARLEAARRLKFLIVVAQPSIPERAEYPQRAYLLVTAGVVLMVLFFIISLTVAIIREHS